MEQSPNVSLAVLLAAAATLPKVMGPKKCGKHGVGEVVRELRAELPCNGVGPFAIARRDALRILESHCRLCARCKLGRALAERAAV